MALDPQAQQILDMMAAAGMGDLTAGTAAEVKARAEAMPRVPGPEVANVHDVSIPGPAGNIPARVYRPTSDGAPLPALVWFHGGGWVIGSVDGSDASVRGLTNEMGCVIVSVDYRMAPEFKFPVPAEECYSATKWVSEHAASLGVDPARLAVGGDSAGGNLAAAVAQMAKARGGPALGFQLLVYPVTNFAYDTASYTANAGGYLLTQKDMRWFWDQYLRTPADGADPIASPARAMSLAGLPPAHVITAEFDPLRDEGEAYADALRAAGVPTTSTRYDGMIHGFFGMAGAVDKGKLAVSESAARLRAAFGMA
jgi:acetyl esterase